MNKAAVIMCTWKRIECLDDTLELLSQQRCKDFDFHIFNNNIGIKNDVESKCLNYKNKLNIYIKHSDVNVGGFGRFLSAKEICCEYGQIIFIDDDQIFSVNTVGEFLNKFEPNTIKSRWAFRFNSDSYYDRYQVLTGNKLVHYCGTGGMIVPAELFNCEEIYKIPEEFKFVEDLWLCFVANHYLKYKLMSIDGYFIKQIADGKDQSTFDFLSVKDKLLKYLIKEREWKILSV